MRRCDVGQPFEREACRVVAVCARRTVRAVRPIVVSRRRHVLSGDADAVSVMFVRDADVLGGSGVHAVRRSRCRHDARRYAGRQICNRERSDDIARCTALPATQPRENARSIFHGRESL